MMRYLHQIGCLFFIICLTGCNHSANKESSVINVASALSSLSELIYSKQTGKVMVNELEEGLTDDWSGFLSFQPQFVSPQGEFAGLFDAFDISGWFEDHPDKAGNLPDKFEQFKSMDEEDNPVVFILK